MKVAPTTDGKLRDGKLLALCYLHSCVLRVAIADGVKNTPKQKDFGFIGVGVLSRLEDSHLHIDEYNRAGMEVEGNARWNGALRAHAVWHAILK